MGGEYADSLPAMEAGQALQECAHFRCDPWEWREHQQPLLLQGLQALR